MSTTSTTKTQDKLRKYQAVVNGLSQILAETYLLQLQTQNYHWNVTGSNFYQLHKLFEDQYDELSEAVDEIAERIRTYGAKAPGTFEEFNKLSKLAKDNNPVDEVSMLQNLIESHNIVLKTLHTCQKASQDAGDEAAADLCIERQRAHDKHLWMLTAQNQI